MSESNIIKPDMDFIRDVIDNGGESVKKCFQCSTCSVVCNISPDKNPFPRKEMIWTQWGLKDKIFNNPDIWLCHQCNDCTVYCPRGAKPGNVLAALRNAFVKHYTFPKFLFNIIQDKKQFGTALAIPVLFLSIMLIILGITGMLNENPGPVRYANMMPHLALNLVFSTLFFLVAFIFIVAIYKYWTGMAKQAGIPCSLNFDTFKKSTYQTLKEIFTHEKFAQCDTAKLRYYAHWMILMAFISLLIVTTAAIFYILFLDYYPLHFTNLFKILGNLGGIALIVGIAMMIYQRLAGPEQEKIGKGTYFDWTLLVVFAVIGITGLFAEFFRLTNIPILAYPTYFVHLVAIFYLLFYAPYTKFAHIVYRTVAILFSKYVALVRENEQSVVAQ